MNRRGENNKLKNKKTIIIKSSKKRNKNKGKNKNKKERKEQKSIFSLPTITKVAAILRLLLFVFCNDHRKFPPKLYDLIPFFPLELSRQMPTGKTTGKSTK